MSRVVFSRLVALAFVLLALSAVVFVLEALVPADPVRAMVGASATRQAVEAKRRELGLDRPLPVQYARFLARAVRGDLSLSLRTRRPVRDDLAQFLPATVELAGAATVLALGLGLLIGTLTSKRGDAIRMLLVGGASTPPFLLGLVLLLAFYAKLGWLPGSGRLSPGLDPPTGPTGLLVVDGMLHGRVDVVVDALRHLVLPATSLALSPAVALGRTLRSSLRTVMRQDYIRTARAKALPERSVLVRHALRNALNAPLTMAGLQVGMLLGGVVVVEAIFAWPGIGLYTMQSVAATDFPAIAGVTLLLGALYVVINALVDIAQVVADPRIRMS